MIYQPQCCLPASRRHFALDKITQNFRLNCNERETPSLDLTLLGLIGRQCKFAFYAEPASLHTLIFLHTLFGRTLLHWMDTLHCIGRLTRRRLLFAHICIGRLTWRILSYFWGEACQCPLCIIGYCMHGIGGVSC